MLVRVVFAMTAVLPVSVGLYKEKWMYDSVLLKSKSCDENVYGAFQELQYALCVRLTTGLVSVFIPLTLLYRPLTQSLLCSPV